jgi:hypothetical protein
MSHDIDEQKWGLVGYRPERRTHYRAPITLEFFWYIFAIFFLKDWIMSAVDSYPYAYSIIASAGVLSGAFLAIRRPNTFTSFVANTRGASLSLRTIITFFGLITFVLLIVFLGGLRRIPWTDDNLLGLGLGCQSQGTVFIESATRVTMAPPTHTPLWAMVEEEGLLTVLALSLIILVSTIAVCATTWGPQKYRSVPLLAKEKVLVFGSFVGVDVLLFLACRQPAFLTLKTAWGTCALSLCLGVIGSGIQDVQSVSTKNETSRQSSPWHVNRGRRRYAFIVCILILAGVITNFVLQAKIAPLAKSSSSVALSSVSRSMQDATVAMEDGHYYQHHGIDWAALHRALRFDLRLGEVKQGGSTITQQLAKNLYLQNNDRSLWRKVEDIALAVKMERMLSKRSILELYLNTIDYGMGQHGIVAASEYYFHKVPTQLTVAESACLVGMVPDPMHEHLDPRRVTEGERTALGRMVFFFPRRYSLTSVDDAMAIPLDRLMYPFKDAWDRGATETIPAVWHGVGFYYFADPGEPTDINNVAACLKPELGAFLDDARHHFRLTGIDHLGVYADRPMRQSSATISAHAYGQAIDISGFRFADGTRVRVADHDEPGVAQRLAPIETMLKRHFDIVVDWRDDPLRHQTHFHCEVQGPRYTTQFKPSAIKRTQRLAAGFS